MASIERTAYPRLKINITQKELIRNYNISIDEMNHTYSNIRGKTSKINYLVLLKCFQNLGYFPPVNEIPSAIIKHIKKQVKITNEQNIVYYKRNNTLYEHHNMIREYLNVRQYDKQAKELLLDSVTNNSYIMENPADLINSAIDSLVKNNYELPAYSHIDRLILEIRTKVLNETFEKTLQKISDKEKKLLDSILEVHKDKIFSDFNYLKEPSKKTTFKNMKNLIAKLKFSESLGSFENILNFIPYLKVKHFAKEAYSLDSSELKKYSDSKRYTLLISFLHICKSRLRDELVEMFIKSINKATNRSKIELKKVHDRLRSKTEKIVSAFTELLINAHEIENNKNLGKSVRNLISDYGGQEALYSDCISINYYKDDNYYIFLHKFLGNQRSNIFKLLEVLEIDSSTEDKLLIEALQTVRMLYSNKKSITAMELVDLDIDLSFTGDKWQRLIKVKKDGKTFLNRENLESCVFSCLVAELKCGDVFVKNSENYADYRTQLLSWEECRKEIPKYCEALGLNSEPDSFVEQLKEKLTKTAEKVDEIYPGNSSLLIEPNGKIILKQYESKKESKRVKELEEKIFKLIPERNILEVLCNTHHWVPWTRHFGHISGSDNKLDNDIEKYLLTSFTYGCNLGPVQAAKHLNGLVSAHTLSYLNNRHVTSEKLDAALRDIINKYKMLELPTFWGTGKHAAADGTMVEMFRNNIISEYHIRYGKNGGIMFHLLSDTYIALMGTFIPCGTWEAVHLLDLFIQNKSEIQPDTIHGDTQEQSGTVFALSYLLGVNLMPRIRNWKDLSFFRPSIDTKYKHIDTLFNDTVDWNLIETHWKDIFQVVISIKEGKILPSTLLKKLNNQSRKNRLFHAFRELGMVIRTTFLLKYIIDMDVRQKITNETNKVESYNGFIDKIRFGDEGVIKSNNPIEQEKRIKYSELVANAVILQNAVDITNAINQLLKDGNKILKRDVEKFSPYLLRNLKRFGDYHINVNSVPEPFLYEMQLLIK